MGKEDCWRSECENRALLKQALAERDRAWLAIVDECNVIGGSDILNEVYRDEIPEKTKKKLEKKAKELFDEKSS